MNVLKKISLVFTMGFNTVGILLSTLFLLYCQSFGEGLLILLVMVFFMINIFAVIRWDDE